MKGHMELWIGKNSLWSDVIPKKPLMLISQRKKIDNLKNSLLLDSPIIFILLIQIQFLLSLNIMEFHHQDAHFLHKSISF